MNKNQIKYCKRIISLSSSIIRTSMSFFTMANNDRYSYDIITHDEISKFNKISELERKI